MLIVPRPPALRPLPAPAPWSPPAPWQRAPGSTWASPGPTGRTPGRHRSEGPGGEKGGPELFF